MTFPSARFRTLLLAGALGWMLPQPAAGQRLLPAGSSPFELPIAAPRATGFAGRIVMVDRGESSFGRGTEADVVLGENLPILMLGSPQRPWIVDFSVGTQARFSLTDPKSSLISNDWVVGFDISGRIRRTEVAVQLFHESSHLGDEYAERFGESRIDWTREVIMAWVGVRAGQAKVRAAVGSVLVDELGLERPLAAFAIDYRGRDGFFGRTPARVIAGVYTEGAAATGWRLSTTLRAGIEFGPVPSKRLALGLVVHDGLSTQRQFYRAESRYAGFEVRFDL